MPLLPANLPNESAPESLTGGEGASFSAPVRTPSPPCTYPTIMEGTRLVCTGNSSWKVLLSASMIANKKVSIFSKTVPNSRFFQHKKNPSNTTISSHLP